MTVKEMQKYYDNTPPKEKEHILEIIKILDNKKTSNVEKGKLIQSLNGKLEQENFSIHFKTEHKNYPPEESITITDLKTLKK